MTLDELKEIEVSIEDPYTYDHVILMRRLFRYAKRLRAQVRSAESVYATTSDPYERAEKMHLCLKD